MTLRASAQAQQELEHWAASQGYRCIVGVDEAGRGPWAGPVTAAAVILSLQNPLQISFFDSKTLSSKHRDTLAPQIHTQSLAWSVVHASVEQIDRENILRATLSAMATAVREVIAKVPSADCVLVDGTQTIPGLLLPCHAFPKGDGRSQAIAAASILAKTTRDAYMCQLDAEFPGYGFAAHKGYGTAQHQEALRRLGPCEAHRRSFAPIRALLSQPSLF